MYEVKALRVWALEDHWAGRVSPLPAIAQAPTPNKGRFRGERC